MNELKLALWELTEIQRDALAPDGPPIDPRSILYALHFLNILPRRAAMPNVAIEDEHIVLDWWGCSLHPPRQSLEVIVYPDGLLWYSAWIDGAQSSGTAHMLTDRKGELIERTPKEILQLIRKGFPS